MTFEEEQSGKMAVSWNTIEAVAARLKGLAKRRELPFAATSRLEDEGILRTFEDTLVAMNVMCSVRGK